ncbi:beta-N-acetylglucosaminidase domain-containing protein [Micromonospora sp. NPDC007271]|uniref:beta-N-acetylglucosaminidase domain-containing protein n=1 Tax=Micromonospora sp. NPDC007271 TaxID=3154587 RepID=UPI0033F2AF85
MRARASSHRDQLRQIGVRHFVIAWDDVFATRLFSCSTDTGTYGTGVTAWARAQADVTNFVQTQFISTHADMGALRSQAGLLSMPRLWLRCSARRW